jgi:HEAT repeat protein
MHVTGRDRTLRSTDMTTAAILEEIEKQIRGDGDTAELAWALRDEGAVEVVAYVARLLASPSANVRGSAAMTLGQMGEMAAPAVGSIAKLIEDGDEDVIADLRRR